MSVNSFKDLLKDITFRSTKPELPTTVQSDEVQCAAPDLRILAARLEDGELRVAFAGAVDVRITACVVDNTPTSFSLHDSQQLVARPDGECAYVLLKGTLNKQTLESPPCWIDHEQELQASSYERSLRAAMGASIRPGEWNFGAWNEILRLFTDYLRYMPRQSGAAEEAGSGLQQAPVIAPDESIFSDYDVQVPSSLSHHARIEGLRDDILRFFGFGAHRQESDAPFDAEDPGDDESRPDAPDSDPLPPTKARRDPEADRRRGLRTLEKIVAHLTDPDFLQQRGIRQLGVDLGVTSILFRCGLAEGWLEYNDFFQLTHSIWAMIFFAADNTPGAPAAPQGWLFQRYDAAVDKQRFVTQLANVHLAVSLMAWALAVREEAHSAEYAFFTLAAATAIGRFPWLWQGADQPEFESAVIVSLLRTNLLAAGDNAAQKRVRSELRQLMAIGSTLEKIERSLTGMTPPMLDKVIRQHHLKQGTLLWQGRRGLCVLGEDCCRTDKGVASVLSLQNETESKFKKNFLTPIEQLIQTSLLQLSDAEVSAFRTFVKRLLKRAI